MHRQHGRNYAFFDAPVGLIFTIDRGLEQGSWLDYGMFLQNVMVAARARGLDTCPQAAFMKFHRVIARRARRCRTNEMLVCGMSLGYADPDAPENRLVTERAPVAAVRALPGLRGLTAVRPTAQRRPTAAERERVRLAARDPFVTGLGIRCVAAGPGRADRARSTVGATRTSTSTAAATAA